MEDSRDQTNSKSLVIFGRDVSKMPCFRNSYLYGISSGIGLGLAYFMFTSRTKAACNFGVLGFTCVTLGYWSKCRYQYSQTKFDMLRLQELMRHQQMYEGTAIDSQQPIVVDSKDVVDV